MSHSAQLLRQRYLALTNDDLPNLASQRQFPVRFNHCFQRIVLDNLFGRCWYEVLDQKSGAAYKQLTTEQLQAAVAIAEAIVDQPNSYIQQLNQNSLRWRGKAS
ncbi:MAG: hypothetical protein ACFB4J_18805 [Elainellaceae cyanobacterium]